MRLILLVISLSCSILAQVQPLRPKLTLVADKNCIVVDKATFCTFSSPIHSIKDVGHGASDVIINKSNIPALNLAAGKVNVGIGSEIIGCPVLTAPAAIRSLPLLKVTSDQVNTILTVQLDTSNGVCKDYVPDTAVLGDVTGVTYGSIVIDRKQSIILKEQATSGVLWIPTGNAKLQFSSNKYMFPLGTETSIQFFSAFSNSILSVSDIQ